MIGGILIATFIFHKVFPICKDAETLTALEKEVLNKHNEKRALHEDTPSLCYGESGDDVTFTAQKWTEHLAFTQEMTHSTQETWKFGENIAMAGKTGDPYTQSEAYLNSVEAWYAEVTAWNFVSSRKVSAGDVTGHFTQVVWRDSKQVTCGYDTLVFPARGYFPQGMVGYMVVCQYFPAGNWLSKYKESVMPLRNNVTHGSGGYANKAIDNGKINLMIIFGLAYVTTVYNTDCWI